MNVDFPKVLILGTSFNKRNGAGITLSNLFKDWPKEKLAVASNINLSNNFDNSICEIYYQLGYNGKLHPFPLNIILPKIKCGLLDISKKQLHIRSEKKNNKFSVFYSFLTKALNLFGIYHFIYKLKITPEFIEWINDYQPDLIYTQLSTLESIRFVNNVQILTNKPITIHMMDDWPSNISKPGLLYYYWKRIIDKEFRQLLEKSTILMSICDAMTEEYKIRYNKIFIPFHNPIEIEDWLPFSKNNWEIGKVMNILYTGRIGRANGKSILMLADVINSVNSEKIKIKLDIFTPDNKAKKAAKINNMRGVQVKNTVMHKLMPKILPTYDILFLPLDFDKEGISFAQFSMPTKTSEYMISGTPILVFADKCTALTKYAMKFSWAYIVSDNNKKVLAEALNKLYSNIELRKELGQKAKLIAIQNENSQIVRSEFKSKLITNRT